MKEELDVGPYLDIVNIEAEAMEMVGQGAESKVYRGEYLGYPVIVKHRFSKKYRLPEIDDQINRKRILSEARCQHRCRELQVKTPILYYVDPYDKVMIMEEIQGITLKQMIYDHEGRLAELEPLLLAFGNRIARLHGGSIIHGDLTTSNCMIEKDTQAIVMIDFGLAYMPASVEDRACDLYVLERSFLATHANASDLFSCILKGYQEEGDHEDVLQKLAQVRSRGRKKLCFG